MRKFRFYHNDHKYLRPCNLYCNNSGEIVRVQPKGVSNLLPIKCGILDEFITTDCNNKDLFEHDIVIISKEKYVITKSIDFKIWDYRSFLDKYDDTNYELNYHHDTNLSDINRKYVKKIGNLHQNKNLLNKL